MGDLRALAVCMQVPGVGLKNKGIPLLMKGDPGIGKTACVEQVTHDLTGKPPVVLIGSIQDPTDLGGLPIPTDTDNYRKAAPAWAKALAEKPGTLFLDEITQCNTAQQHGLMRIVHERVVGELPLNRGTVVIAACNPADQVGGFELNAALSNRLCQIDWAPPSLDEWIQGTLFGWAKHEFPSINVDAFKASMTRMNLLITAFHRSKSGTLLQKLPKNQSGWSNPWPSIRSWEMGTLLLAGVEALYGMDENLAHMLLSGCVGTGPASEAIAFIRSNDLPDPEDTIAHPERFKVDPHRVDRTFAIYNSAVIAALKQHPQRRQRLINAAEIALRIHEQGQSDVGAVGVRPIVQFIKKEMSDLESEQTFMRLGRTYLNILKAVKH